MGERRNTKKPLAVARGFAFAQTDSAHPQGTATIAIPRGMLPVAADPLATAVSLPVLLLMLYALTLLSTALTT